MAVEHMTGAGEAQPRSERRVYEPPRAEFVPLQVEERLMACNKMPAMPVCTSSTPPANLS